MATQVYISIADTSGLGRGRLGRGKSGREGWIATRSSLRHLSHEVKM